MQCRRRGMSDLKAIRFDNLQASFQRLAAQHGIDLDDVTETIEERGKRLAKEAYQSYLRRSNRDAWRMSVWSGHAAKRFTFADWDVTVQGDSQLAAEIGNQAYKLTNQIFKQPMNVLLLGKGGVGKTSLALAMLYKLAEQFSVMFVSTTELASMLNNQYSYADAKERIRKIEEAMKTVDVLILDDFGTEGGMKIINGSSENIQPVRKDMQELLFRVADERIDAERNCAKRTTIITTNNTQKQLEMMYNPKLISRLLPKAEEQRIKFNGMGDVRRV